MSKADRDPRLVEARKALGAIRRAILSEQNSLSIVCTVWMDERDSKNETVVDYIDRTFEITK